MSSLIEKAVRSLAGSDETVSKASTGTLSSYVLNAPPQYGQPLPQQMDASGLITPARMREVVLRTPTASAAMNAILDYAAGVCLHVQAVDAAKRKKTDPRIEFLAEVLRRPNAIDSGRHWTLKLARDLVTLGFGGVEIEPGKQGAPLANLWVLDAARLKIDYDEHGDIEGYDMLDAHGVPITGNDGTHAWEPAQVAFFSANPVSHSQYPSSRITQLFAAAVIEDMMMAFIGGKFTDSNVPFGVMGLGDLTPDELKKAVALWNTQATSQHRIMLTGHKGPLGWVPFGYHLKDLEATGLLTAVRAQIMAILGVTMNELGESQDINKSNGYNLSYTFKKRAIEPLLDEICETFTTRIVWDTLGWRDLEMVYEEIDSRDELLQGQIDDLYLKNGIYSFNQIANRKGQSNIPGGDVHAVFTGSAYIPVDMIEDFAQAQLRALNDIDAETEEMTAQAKQAGAGGGGAAPLKPLVSAPLVRPPQGPEKYTTPDGSGSSTAKVKLPKPQVNTKPTSRPAGPARTMRGAAQASRNAGMRKESNQ